MSTLTDTKIISLLELKVGEEIVVMRNSKVLRFARVSGIHAKKGVMLNDYPKYYYPPDSLGQYDRDGIMLSRPTQEQLDDRLRAKLCLSGLKRLNTAQLEKVALLALESQKGGPCEPL